MKKLLIVATLAVAALANVRVNVRVGVGHPIRRPARTVVVRRPVVVPARVVYAAPVIWTRTAVALPGRDRLVWEDSEVLTRPEDWVDTTLKVNARGDALYLRTEGRVQIDFAEVEFENGQVQVVDFNEAPLERGTFKLLDFKDGRKVESVRLIARSRTPRARVTVLMAK